MNSSQARHSKAIARKIRIHADGIVSQMGAIERENLSDVPLDVVKGHFDELERRWRNIQGVLKDMLPELDDQ